MREGERGRGKRNAEVFLGISRVSRTQPKRSGHRDERGDDGDALEDDEHEQHAPPAALRLGRHGGGSDPSRARERGLLTATQGVRVFFALRESRRVFHRGRSVRGRGSAGRRLMIPMPRRANPSARTTRKRSRAASRPVRSRFTFVADIIFFRFILFVQGGLKNLGVGRRRLAFARQPPRSARVALHPLRARHHPLRLSPRLLTCSLPPRSGTRTSPWLSRWG